MLQNNQAFQHFEASMEEKHHGERESSVTDGDSEEIIFDLDL